ncbi:MAG: hypothetical protein ACFCUO_10140, partial [Rhodospirillales bacterium]
MFGRRHGGGGTVVPLNADRPVPGAARPPQPAKAEASNPFSEDTAVEVAVERVLPAVRKAIEAVDAL